MLNHPYSRSNIRYFKNAELADSPKKTALRRGSKFLNKPPLAFSAAKGLKAVSVAGSDERTWGAAATENPIEWQITGRVASPYRDFEELEPRLWQGNLQTE